MRVKKKSFALFLLSALIFFGGAIKSDAAPIDELKAKIEERNKQKREIAKEIAEYEEKAIEAGKSAKTLQGTINELNIAKKKIEADIKANENKINLADLSIKKLGIEIADTQRKIKTNDEVVSSAFRKINEAEGTSFIENILAYDNVSALWDEVETLLRFQIGVKKNIDGLKILKKEIQNKKNEKEKNKREMLNTKSELNDQNDLIRFNKEDKDQLLSVTKNKEANYKKILAEKKALSEAFAKELLKFESELKLAIDPKSIPSVGAGVLFWPLDKIFITQYFGDTDFAMKTNAYNGKGHNGVDFQAAPGTRVKAALDGIVMGTGDTDKVCKGASFGKWALLKHNNGLSTLYAHLSLIKVSEGQTVKTGDIVGYSGNTGYSTGPHLHFTVYATQGVQIMDRQSAVCGGIYHMPIADLRAYLNPMLYL
ncbi:MAG: peptidoglycan DD-metalloendopeptidase family protein [Patescibacteria group bacterium]|nr:peptidoglycan DD-metalloendopeptidase family protein [Patescibacteria group bacterium]MDE1988803.1 peptidoglycan DD-metalloendopeptidase family protein [Patescibacteria group bacterium]MDE2218158.1 peptidoglycan DD-metalloendopeptidase family protein [Patescibacteria group bacterium]